MATIGEFRELLDRCCKGIKHTGATEAWKKGFWDKIKEVDMAIMEDFSKCAQETSLLADDVRLGAGATQAFAELQDYLKKNRTFSSASLL